MRSVPAQHYSTHWVADRLGLRRGKLESLVLSIDSHYRPFTRSKLEGGVRTIDNPDEALKGVQRRIVDRLLRPRAFPACAHGCLPGRSPVTNAKCHLGQKCHVRVDLRDFFPSITHHHIYAAWSACGFGPDVARLLTRLTTYRGYLPQGAPTSSYLANLVFLEADANIEAAAERLGVRYTRYVDDIILSGENARSLVGEAVRQIHALGLSIKRSKTVIAGPRDVHEATGFSVNRSGMPSVGRPYRDRVRAAIRSIRQAPVCASGKGSVSLENRIRSRIAFVARTNPGAAVRLERQLASTLGSGASGS